MRSTSRAVLPLPSSERYLGPATVVDGDARAVRVRLPGGEIVVAELALALSYEPAAGDSVLVISENGVHYGIGVLRGKGRLVLETQGDIAIKSGGQIELSAPRVSVTGETTEIKATKLSVVAEAVTQRVTSWVQRVHGLLSVHAKESHTLVEKSAITQAKNASILTEDAVSINGKSVLLG
ncbi:MAG: DUF3540 domain-containing protein [Polyangiaceae bacterium]